MPMVKHGRSNGFKENLESIKKAYIKSKEEENQVYQNFNFRPLRFQPTTRTVLASRQ
jgi:hypothetical protein